MFKLVKYTFLSTLIFFGLYFFGDFRINDTNVRDYLHKNVTWDRVVLFKNESERLYHLIHNLVADLSAESDANGNKNTVENTKDGKTKSDNTSKVIEGLPMDQINGKDHKELIKILKDNINQLEKNQK